MSWVTIVMLVTIGLVNVISRIGAAQKKAASASGEHTPQPMNLRSRQEPPTAPRVERAPRPIAGPRSAASASVASTARSDRTPTGRVPAPGVMTAAAQTAPKAAKAAAVPPQSPSARSVAGRTRKPWTAGRMREGIIASIVLAPPPSASR